ncbi:Hypothetical protein, putative [Bodo saltans]|uniref:Nucleolar complex protein 2 n=1 Tax=Bodo saltans TaxID=75058 RepID=A0A0S4IWR5_BODSA|nr:Hypothetical protein, putative [Bodo saltans]|eukprot:CUF39419.1 Hypothetical protein, putative [Bodo saltans]
MPPTKDKKSFKKFAKKHLATVIEGRRKGAKAKKEKIERVERRKEKEVRETQREDKEHADQLDRLKDTDPEFYSYLESEDPTLLQFGNEDMELVGEDSGSDAETEADEDEDLDNLEDSDDEEGAVDGERELHDPNSSSNKPAPMKRVTKDEVEAVIKGKKMESAIDIFVSAARELGYDIKDAPKGGKVNRKFDEPALVKDSLVSIARFCGQNVSTLISGKGTFKNHKTRYLIKRLVSALIVVVGEGGGVDPNLTATLMHSVVPFVPILHYIKGLTKTVLKVVLNLCANLEERVRVSAYVVVRAIATRATGTRSMYQSTAFKGVFLALIRTAHQYTIHNLPIVSFLMNCVVDLYGTDMEAAYQHAFVYTRQLAVYLRAVLQNQSQANVRAVFNWQYLNALRAWGLVVSTYSEPAQLGPLVHPVVQIALGVMDLFASPRMFPMHLHMIEMLNHITTRADGVYIPISSYILRILSSPSMSLSAKDSGASAKRGRDDADAVDLQFTMRIKKAQARSMTYRLNVWQGALYLLTEHLAVHSCSVGFPEAFWSVESTLKKLKQVVKVPKIHSQISTILKHFETTVKKLVAKRDQGNFGPCDVTAVKQFEDEMKVQGNPLIQYHQALRQQRVAAFAAKQNVIKERTTLDSVAQGGAKKFQKKARREDKEDDE